MVTRTRHTVTLYVHGLSCRNYLQRPIHSQLNCNILLCDIIPDGKLSKLRSLDRQLNCPFQSSFTHRPAQVTQGIPQFPRFTCQNHDGIISRHSTSTSVYSNSFSRRASQDILLSKYHFLLHILRFIFFFTYNIMAEVASKHQTTDLFLSTTVTRTELTKNWQTWWETCVVPENIQFSFSCSFLKQLNYAV
jgi:hypothetical protein